MQPQTDRSPQESQRRSARPVARAALLELFVLALLLGTVLYQAQQRVSGQPLNSTIGFEPAISIAAGNGFTLLLESAPRVLQAFRDAEVESLDAVPTVVSGRRPAYTQRIHMYYYYALGLLWRAFGLSWPVIRLFLVLALALCAFLAYAILRQCMNRWFGLLAALWVVQGLLPYMPQTREFLRTPFMLGAILLLLLVLKRKRSPRGYLGLAALFGLTLGVGIGFRSDVLIPLPAGILVFALAPVAKVRHPLLLRFAALVLVFLCFQGAGWPVLQVAGAEGDPVAMQAVNGMSQGHTDALGLSPGSYYWKYKKWDAMTVAVTADYGRRVLGIPEPIPFLSPKYTASGNALLLEMARFFPADFVTRAYGAVFQLLGGSILFALLAALALLRISWTSPARAWAVFLSVMAFLTAYSLQFEARHYFFLAIAPAVLLGFWAERLLCGARAILRARRGRAGLEALFLPWGSLRAGWRGAALFLAVGVALLALPLMILRPYQAHAVGELRQTYARLPVEEVQTKRIAGDECTFFRLDTPLVRPDWFRLSIPEWRFRHFYWAWPVQYLAAEFELDDHNLAFWPAYDNRMRTGMGCMSEWIHVMPPIGPGSGRVRCFFPVYECHAPMDLGPNLSSGPMFDYTRFSGVVVPNALAPAFRGLYRCTDASALTLLPCMFLPEREDAFQPYCRMGETSADFPRAPLPHEFQLNIDTPPDKLRWLMDKDPANPMCYLQKAAQLMGKGDFVRALAMCRRAIEVAPYVYAGYCDADACLQRKGDPAGRIAFWEEVAAAHPDVFYAHAMHAHALQETEKKGDALLACQRAVDLAPRNPELLRMLGDLHVASGDAARARAAYEKAVACAPGYPEYRAGLIKAEGLAGNLEAAGALHLELRAKYPRFRRLYDTAYYRMAAELAEQGMTEEAKTAYRTLLGHGFRSGGGRLPITAAGDAHLFLGDLEAARAAYRRAIEVRPRDFAPYDKLNKTYLERDDLQGLLEEWERAVATSPSCALAHFCLGVARQRLYQLDGAIDSYRRALRLDPSGQGTRYCLARALVIRGNQHLEAGGLEAALEDFVEAAKIDTANAEARTQAGATLEALGRPAEARAYLPAGD